jgi:ketosteroid isomerase-like protein
MKTTLSLSNMRKLIAMLTSVIILTAFATKSNAQSSEISGEVRTELEQLNRTIEKSIKAHDLSTIVDMYADDATIILSGGKKISGRKAIAEYWYSLGNVKSLKSEINELGGSGKIVYQVGKWTFTSVKDGIEKITTTDIVIVWKKNTNYEYKIQLNSSNNPVASNGKQATSFEAEKTN